MIKKIAIVSGKGGVGKSMVSSALSVLFSKKHKIAAVDCDVDAPNLAIWLNERGDWTETVPVIASARPEIDYKKCDKCGLCAAHCQFGAISDKIKLNPFLCEGCGVCEIVCPQKAIKIKPVQNGEIKIKKTKYNFPLISGQLFPGESGSGKIVSQVKKEAEKFKSDIMLIDSAPGTGCPVIASLQGADFALLVVEPTIISFSDLKKVLKIVNVPYGVVINKWDVDKKMSLTIKKWSKKNFLGLISYDKNILKVIPIMETNLQAKEEIKEIYTNLLERLNK